MQLGDLVQEEFRQFDERRRDPSLGTEKGLTDEEFVRRIAAYEAMAEPLARTLGILGRWGGEAEFDLARNCLREAVRSDQHGGLVVWLDLQAYPAVLMLYSYGIAALKSGRFESVFRWRTTELRNNGDEKNREVCRRLIGEWGGNDNRLWQKLPGMDRHRTALSDHMHDLFGDWMRDYTISDRERTYLFESFETLAAMAYISLRSSKSDLGDALSRTDGRAYVRAPIGRTCWHRETREEIFADLDSGEMTQSLVEAGFNRGDRGHYAMAVRSLKNLMEAREWG